MIPNRSLLDCIDSGFVPRCAPKCITDVNRTETILFQTNDMIVLDKPCDVRMDGDFDVTVEKLVLHWLKISEREKCTGLMPRWVHQLDFATSGVLCVALSKRAA